MDGRRLGSIVGATGGLGFVLGSAGGVPATLLWQLLAAALGVAVLVAVWRTTAPAPPPPSREGLRLYGICVVAMLVAVPLGARLLTVADLEHLVRVWVVLVVGLHFLPFARAFGTPLFTRLGVALVGVALVGAALATVSGADDDTWPAATAVAAGFVLLGFALGGLLVRNAETTTATPPAPSPGRGR